MRALIIVTTSLREPFAPLREKGGGGLGGLGLGTCQILYDQAGKSHAEDGSDMAEAAVNPGFVVTSLAGWQTFIGKQFV